MPRPPSKSDDDDLPKFDLQSVMPLKRVGIVSHVVPEKQFGFIEAEDFREDVFFHFDIFEPERLDQLPVQYMPVEFEIDEQHRRETGKLRARGMRRTQRPISRRLVARDAPRLQIRHHPNALRRRPGWRKKEIGGKPGPSEPTSDGNSPTE
jgi:cold shock CspA family protein